MRNPFLRLLIALCAVFPAALFRAPLHNPRVSPDQDLFARSDVDARVKAILDRSCADCHSYRTRWPWYARFSPIRNRIERDVTDAREHLNFSRWPNNPANTLEEIAGVIDARAMPPASYLRLHRQARLSDEDRKVLSVWIDSETRSAAVVNKP